MQYGQYIIYVLAALEIFGVIAKVTPTPVDNEWYSWILKIIKTLGLNPDNYKDKWGW